MESVTVSAGNRRGVKLPVWGHSPEILIWRNRLWFLREAERGVSVRGTVPLVIPGVIPAPMQRVADATQVTADPTQPRANYSSPPGIAPTRAAPRALAALCLSRPTRRKSPGLSGWPVCFEGAAWAGQTAPRPKRPLRRRA